MFTKNRNIVEELSHLIKVETIYKTMLSYCWKYRKYRESKNPKVAKTKKE